MTKAQEILYATLGAGDFAVDKVKGVRRIADRKTNQKLYKDFVKRGRGLTTQVKNSTPGKEISARTEPVRSQAEEALKTVTKAFGVNVVAWPKKRPAARKSSPARKSPARKTSTRKTSTRKTTAKKAS